MVNIPYMDPMGNWFPSLNWLLLYFPYRTIPAKPGEQLHNKVG